ncbi:putative ABC transport system substrate-binding protein [Alteribacillus persepolensis]|uniref:Putative ABC transport system substrate-binding protein n=1 Tax=Alteribacillus persepolensis TaxID=568899 RepID=A0A1G8H5H0_9BACI|nr:ABC transporter substrate-binding protein [Alteribacillus persepolensis]SDI01876.1 putative ABC transport system substrate-binding protein [Alteribacillus persepolensis]
MKKRWLQLLLGGALSITVLTACGSGNDEDASNEGEEEAAEGDTEEPVVVGATQIVEHPSLDEAYAGFKEALEDEGYTEGENIEYDYQNAQNDQNNTVTIANNFIADDVDLIFANSTPSAQAALQASTDTPIVFTSVTDAVEAGLIEELETPSELVTGVMDLHPEGIQKTVEFIADYFPEANVGMIYNSGEQNSVSQIEEVEAAMEGTDLEMTTRSVSSSAEVQQAAESLVGEVDAMYIVTDNTVVSALETVVGIAETQGIPLFAGEADSLERGAFAAYGIDYRAIGYRAGEMAADILSGEQTPSDIPAEYPENINLIINKEAAEAQGIEIHEDWEESAEFINE